MSERESECVSLRLVSLVVLSVCSYLVLDWVCVAWRPRQAPIAHSGHEGCRPRTFDVSNQPMDDDSNPTEYLRPAVSRLKEQTLHHQQTLTLQSCNNQLHSHNALTISPLHNSTLRNFTCPISSYSNISNSLSSISPITKHLQWLPSTTLTSPPCPATLVAVGIMSPAAAVLATAARTAATRNRELILVEQRSLVPGGRLQQPIARLETSSLRRILISSMFSLPTKLLPSVLPTLVHSSATQENQPQEAFMLSWREIAGGRDRWGCFPSSESN